MAAKIFLFLYISLISVASGDQLTPFIAWSNNEVLSSMEHTTDIDNIIDTLTSADIKTVILFGCEDLSFDDIVKYGGVFAGESDFTNLKNSMNSAPYQYWTGIKLDSGNWVSKMASGLGLSLKYLDPKDIDNLSQDGFYVISSDDCFAEDAAIGQVMEKLDRVSYLAVFTKFNKKLERRTRRDTVTVGEGISATANNDDGSCSIGGILKNVTNDTTTNSHACLLFCLKQNITFIPNVNDYDGVNGSCNLVQPSTIKWCCEEHLNETSSDFFECYEDPFPSVQLYYLIDTINSTNNTCNDGLFNSTKPSDDAEWSSIEVWLKFIFPSNVTNLISANKWNMVISTTYSVTWTQPAEMNTYSSFLVQQNPSDNLYQNFSIGYGLSYACSVDKYNNYSYSNIIGFNESDSSEVIMGDNVTNGSRIVLSGIQVQPYNVSLSGSFSAADNCIGYFTHVTWMGIVSVAVLLLILYISILCAFSMNTIDQFEDPRGQTISVEKLH